MKMYDVMDKYPNLTQECFCKLKNNSYKILWYNSYNRKFETSEIENNQITHWLPLCDIVSVLSKES